MLLFVTNIHNIGSLRTRITFVGNDHGEFIGRACIGIKRVKLDAVTDRGFEVCKNLTIVRPVR